MTTIAIIDDDIYIGDMLETLLQQNGYATRRAYSGTEALYLLREEPIDLVLLDLMLPGLSGEEVLPHIENIPVIVLSARVDVQDKVDLLLRGAADYITKPFDTKELLARILVQLRCTQSRAYNKNHPVENGNVSHNPWTVGNLTLNLATFSLTSTSPNVTGQAVKLTRTEFAILKLLMENPHQVITKSVMLDKISEDTPDCTERSLKQHISNLRRKIEDVSGVDYIETVWGIGFKLKES